MGPLRTLCKMYIQQFSPRIFCHYLDFGFCLFVCFLDYSMERIASIEDSGIFKSSVMKSDGNLVLLSSVLTVVGSVVTLLVNSLSTTRTAILKL